jgi:hypothetical protein
LKTWVPPPKKKDRPEPKPLTIGLEYRLIEVAHFWRMTPEQFNAQTPENQSKMTAFFFVKNEIENYYHEESMREKPGGRTPTGKQDDL